MTDNTYKIVRFYFNDSPRTIKRGLTLDEAQAHCRRDDTHGEGWFDGYDHDTGPAKCHLDHKTQEALGHDFYRVNNGRKASRAMWSTSSPSRMSTTTPARSQTGSASAFIVAVTSAAASSASPTT